MCDRLCMTFSLKELQALIHLKNLGTMIGPNYVELGTKLKPIQTYNASPHSSCPILLSEKHIYDGIPSNSTVLAIMQWGLSPSWAIKGKIEFKYPLTYAKKETLNKMKTFQTLLEKGHRCILVCEGFYQFLSLGNKRSKQAYFIHLQNIFDTRIKQEIIRPCYIAALFDTFKQSDGQDLYSFIIITVDTPENFSDIISSSIPVIFDDIDQALNWLDFVRIDTNEALHLLENNKEYIEIDPVSNYVLKKINQGPKCRKIISKPIDIIITNTKSEDEIDMEKHLEDIEKQHEDHIINFLDKHKRHSQPKKTKHHSKHSGIKYDEETLLEALSNRTIKTHRK